MLDSIPTLSEVAQNFRHGIYRHYKGDFYRTLCVGRMSEAREEECVVYISLKKGSVWIRPLGMFLENITVGEYKGPRFVWISEQESGYDSL